MKTKLYFGLILLALLFSVCEKTEAQSPDWLWAKAIGGIGGDVGWIALDPAGNGDVYITGSFQETVDFNPGLGIFNLTSTGYRDIFISKLDGSGNFIWAKRMGGTDGFGYGTSIAVDHEGSGDVYTTGNFNGTIDFDPGAGEYNLTSIGERDLFITKLDGSGNFVWAKGMGGTGGAHGNSIAVDPDGSGDIYITGDYNGTVDFDPGVGIFNLISDALNDIFISKLDNSGNFVWAKAIGGISSDQGSSIAINPAGSSDVYTTGVFGGTVDFDPGPGTFNLTSAGLDDIFISKLDSLGNFVWAKAMGGGTDHWYPWLGSSIALDPGGSGDVYTTGYFEGTADFDPGLDTFNLSKIGVGLGIFISKLDGSGDFVWAKAMGGTDGFGYGTSIAVEHEGSGDVYTTGYFEGTADFDPDEDTFNITSVGDADIFVSKLDDAGNFVWANAVGGPSYDRGNSIALDALGHVYVAGSFDSPSISFDSTTLTNADSTGISYDLFIAKLDILTTSVVNVDSKTYQINIYPNPATNELTIKFDEDGILNVGIIIFDVLGEVVYSNQNEFISHQKTIDISSLSTGIYFVELNVNGNRLAQKVVKE